VTREALLGKDRAHIAVEADRRRGWRGRWRAQTPSPQEKGQTKRERRQNV
jgi:hypothetical protein